MRKKIIIMFTISIIIINTLMPVTNAINEITNANLIKEHKITSHIMYYNEDKEEWRNIKCNYICYKLDGEKYPAYCITHGVNGVDEEGAYTVTIDDLLKDKLIYNTIINGYPYKTPEQLGLETEDEAYVATKHAINSVLLDRDVKTFYKAKDEKGEKIINAIYEISEKGKEQKLDNKSAQINVNKIGDLVEYDNYYYQEYNVNSDVEISKYTVNCIKNLPAGSYIADINNKSRENFMSGEKFRVMIPKEMLNKDINGQIEVKVECNTNPIFYGKAPRANIQDYAITYKQYVSYETEVTFYFNTNTSRIKIIKTDEETSKPIKDVEFGLYTENEEYITSGKTNSDGILIFNGLYQGTYKIKELIANENYEKNETVYKVTTKYNKETIQHITNIHKKGNLRITKVDKDENDKVLSGIEFDLINSNDEIVAHMITNNNGVAEIENLNIGNYTIKETKTNEDYNLCIDNNIEIKWNETMEIKIENEKKKGQLKITKQDKENSEIKLNGVEFQILDNENNIVDEVITNSNGIAISKRLPIGDYIIKEKSLGENLEYVLNETEYQAKTKEGEITNIIIENIHKKGNLKITKVDKDDNTITLGAIEFDLIDECNNVVAHLITDVNGEAYIENINTGKYIIKETVTKREYNLCENKDINVEWNKTANIVIENEKKKGNIQIIKQDIEKADIKLEGVKFQIFDSNNKIVDEVVTDKKGEAISSKLLIGEYKVKEVDLGENVDYFINEEIFSLTVNENETTKLIVENKHKSGNIIIKKVDKDNPEIVLKGVKFRITDEDGFEYDTVTNEQGIAQIEGIRVGKVKVKEVETNIDYALLNNEIEVEIKFEELTQIKVENEKLKGQVEIYKIDKDNNNIKIPNVEFEILNEKEEVVDKIVTNEEGYAISKNIAVGEYYIRETKAGDNYVLNEEKIKINIEKDKILKLSIENEKIKGKIKIVKTSSNFSPILNIIQGQSMCDVEFEIYNLKDELVDTLITNEEGQALSKKLEFGKYKIKEKNTNKYYILNRTEFYVNIEKNNEVKVLEIKNEAIIPNLNLEISGKTVAEKNEEIKYEFEIRNSSNSKLDNFTWIEFIPYEQSKITKMVTGIYNENIDYEIYYKTNQNDYVLFKRVNSMTSEYLNFEELELHENEIVTEIKTEFRTVSKDFSEVIKPNVFVKVNDNIKKDEKIINNTSLSGKVEDYVVKDRKNFETIITEKEIIKKLPKTGF